MSIYFRAHPRLLSLAEISSFIDSDATVRLETSKSGSPVLIMKNGDTSRPNELNWLHLVVDEKGVITNMFRNGWSDPTNLLNYLSYMLNVSFISEYEEIYPDID